jgi:hypothetical protein
MRRLIVLFLLAATACSTAPAPQAAAPGTPEFDIEATVIAAYNVVSGPAGRRDWNRFKALFTANGRIVSNGTEMTPEEFQKSVNDELQKTGLFEHPVATKIEQAGDVAQVWTRYESRHATTDPQPFARGVRAFQLVRSGEQWRIASLLMQPE